MPAPTLAEYDSSKIEYLKKKTELKELENKMAMKQYDIQEVDKKLNATSPSSTDANAEEQRNKLTSEKAALSHELTVLDTKIKAKQTILGNDNKNLFVMQSKLAQSKTTSFDSDITCQNDIFAVDTNSLGAPSLSLKEPHKMSDKDVIAYFKELNKKEKTKAIDWISACPKWQHVRLMSLYDKYLENDNESDYSGEPATPEAIVSNSNSGFYEYIIEPKKKYFKKLTALESRTSVTVIDSTNPNYPTVVMHDNENYIYVEYCKDSDYLDSTRVNKTNKVTGYIKKKNIIFQGSTLNVFSTAQSAENFADNLATTSTKLLSKKRDGVTTENTETTGEDKFHLNKTTSDYPNPALLTDKQIYEQFKNLKDNSKNCQGWIDSFLIHNSRMTKIYNMFISDYTKSVTVEGKTNASTENYEKLENNEHPNTLLGVITEKNANVYVEGDGGTLNRVGNLNKGNHIKVSVNPDATSKKLSFEFKVWKSKKYVPILCLSDGKILFGYVNSDFVSFLTTNEESIIKKSDDTQTISASDTAKDALSINTLEDTVKQQSLSASVPRPLEPNMIKNPLLMSDAEIHENITKLNDYDKVYEWASSFPLQKKRIKEIYDKGNEIGSEIQVAGKSAKVNYNFDTNKPTTLMATVTRDGAHVYPAAGDNIALQSGSSIGGKQKIKACGELKKGAKIRLAINSSSSATLGTPLFVSHKDTKGNNTRYLKIQYLDTDYSYKDGFISVNAISTYTLEQEMEEAISSMIDQDFDGSDQEFDSSEQDYKSPSVSGQDALGTVKETALGAVSDAGLDESVEDEIGINGSAYDITVGSFGLASSLVDIVFSVKAYAEKFNIQTAVNTELLAIMSNTTGAVSSTLGLAQSCISGDSTPAKNLAIAGTVFDSVTTGFDILNTVAEKIPEYWDYIQKREGPELETVVDDVMGLLENVNSILGILSDLTTVIPIVSASISILNSAVKFIIDLIKFINDEVQIWKMFNQKKSLKESSATAANENKEQRQKHLDSLNKKIDYFQFKGAKRSDAEDTTLQYLLKERAQYNDLFITTELENVNKKRRNRRVVTMSKDLLNLTGDILGLVAVTVPEPEVIAAATLGSIGVKAAAGAVEIGSFTARYLKKLYNDRDKDNPNNTRNKQIRYGKVAAGMINNILHLPTSKDYPAVPTLQQIQHMKSRYTLIESHITASGAKIKDLKNCNGDVSKMFGVLYSAITKRE